jgi:hypothetical protein
MSELLDDLDQLTRLAEEQAENIRRVVAIVGKRMESEPELSESREANVFADIAGGDGGKIRHLLIDIL